MTTAGPTGAVLPPTVELALPFAGRWLARNSPARRVPSHGTDLWGEAYAIDFVAVDGRRRTADRRDWRTWLGTEPPERFLAFGQPILAPADGVVVTVHDGEADHVARRSQPALLRYALGQRERLRAGVGAIAGNHLVLALRDSGTFLALAHLQAGSTRVAVGAEVTAGQQLATCGSSGNSTQPHLHLQVMDAVDPYVAQGVPMVFGEFVERPRGAGRPRTRHRAVPAEGSVVEPLVPATRRT